MFGIGLAENQLRRGDSSVLSESLADLRAAAGQALANLRQLASGIHPTVLSDHGIVAAIEGHAMRAPLPVTVDCCPSLRERRFHESIEAAAYFFACEALANALKHAEATRVVPGLRDVHDQIELIVSDDGRGFDPSSTSCSGLAGIGDRLAALGGHFDIDSAPGSGTTLTGRLATRAQHVG